MPPQNSPTPFSIDTSHNRSPGPEPSTRLPIVRVDNEGDDPPWRTALDRAIDEVSDSARQWDTFNLQEEEQRLATLRLQRILEGVDQPSQGDSAAFIQQVEQERLATVRLRRVVEEAGRASRRGSAPYRAWGHGSTESDYSITGRAVRQWSRNDPSARDTATRRFQREQEMEPLTRMNSSHRINELESMQTGTEAAAEAATDFAPSSNDTIRSRPRVTVPWLERIRQGRAEMMRERLHDQSSSRREGLRDQRLNSVDASRLPHPTSESQDQSVRRCRTTLFDEQHIAKVFEEVIALLDSLRSCLTELDRSTLLEAAGFSMVNQAEMLANGGLDTKTVLKPQYSSLLRPGASFSGEQTASMIAGMADILRSQRRARIRAEEPPNNIDESFLRATRPWLREVVRSGFRSPPNDRWPVKVTITSVDFKNMTLTGTMEAFSVPCAKGTNSITRDPSVQSITTYLEGEIIDFHTHTLKTSNFKADVGDDANYWLKLHPFASLDIEQIVDGFTDMRWISECISKDWIIMRWKEKCFVSPSDANSGLTISGFYYITLRRSTGKIEGLYHDPQSCPYQRLNLMPDKPTFPIYTIL